MTLTDLARKLRKQQTDAENLLWWLLRNRQLLNCKFRRQFVIESYIVDFVCLDAKLVIELDGSQHMQQGEEDRIRTTQLQQYGFTVLRFWNNDVLNNIEAVMEKIRLTVLQLTEQ